MNCLHTFQGFQGLQGAECMKPQKYYTIAWIRCVCILKECNPMWEMALAVEASCLSLMCLRTSSYVNQTTAFDWLAQRHLKDLVNKKPDVVQPGGRVHMSPGKLQA